MASLAELGEISKAIKWERRPNESEQEHFDRSKRNNAALIGGGIGTVFPGPGVGTAIGAGAGYYGSKHKAKKRNRKES